MQNNINYRVLLTTSGIGSRLGTATKYTNKSLVTVGDRAAISQIIESYPDDIEIVITVGYFGDHVRDYVSLAYPNTVLDIWEELLTEENLIYIEVPTYDSIDMKQSYWLVYEHMSYFSKYSFLKLMNAKFREVEYGIHKDNNIYYIGRKRNKKI